MPVLWPFICRSSSAIFLLLLVVADVVCANKKRSAFAVAALGFEAGGVRLWSLQEQGPVGAARLFVPEPLALTEGGVMIQAGP